MTIVWVYGRCYNRIGRREEEFKLSIINISSQIMKDMIIKNISHKSKFTSQGYTTVILCRELQFLSLQELLYIAHQKTTMISSRSHLNNT